MQFVHGSEVKCRHLSYDDSYHCRFTELARSETTNQISLPLRRIKEIPFDKVDSVTIEPISNGLQIDHIPAEVFTIFPNLSALEIQSNIQELTSEDFINVKRLRILDLTHNKLKRLTAGTFRSVELFALNVGFNEIGTIDDFTFENQSTLFGMDLQYNKLSIIKRHTFTGLSDINTLHLNDNEIETIEDDAFQLPMLRNLFLRGNKLTKFNEKTFTALPALIRLNLDSNKFDHIDLDLFSRLPKLKTLSLGYIGNKLQNLKMGANMTVDSVTELSLEGNNLDDSTHLEMLRIFAKLQNLDLSNNKYEKFDFNEEMISEILPELHILRFTTNDNNRQNCLKLKTSLSHSINVEVKCDE